VLMETIINLCGAITEFANLRLVLGASGGSDPISSYNKYHPTGPNSPVLSLSLFLSQYRYLYFASSCVISKVLIINLSFLKYKFLNTDTSDKQRNNLVTKYRISVY
jgi:hypothetical protein